MGQALSKAVSGTPGIPAPSRRPREPNQLPALCLHTVFIHNLHTESNTTSLLPLLHSEHQQAAPKEPGHWESLLLLSREQSLPRTCNSGPPPKLWIPIFLNQAQVQGQQELLFPPHPSRTKEHFTEFPRHTWAYMEVSPR